MSETKRIQFEFAPAVIQRLDAIKQNTCRTSYAEVVRDSLRLFEWWMEQQQAGYDIGLVKDDVLVKIVVMKF